MKLETLKADCKEIFLETDSVNVTVFTWSNLEGASLLVHDTAKGGLQLRMAGSFRWEDIDAILVALNAARAV